MPSSQDAPITELTAACEAAEQKLNSISIAGQLQMTDRQLEDSQQLRTEYLARCVFSRFGMLRSVFLCLVTALTSCFGANPAPSLLYVHSCCVLRRLEQRLSFLTSVQWPSATLRSPITSLQCCVWLIQSR